MRLGSLPLVIVLTFAPAAYSFAQVEIGIAGGIANGNIEPSFEGGGPYGDRTLPVAGAVIDASFGHWAGLRLEPAFLSRGTIYSGRGTTRVRYDFAEVPVLIRLSPNWSRGGHDPRFFVAFGPSVGFRVRTVIEGRPNFSGLDEDTTRGTNLSIVAGGGVELPIGRTAIVLEAYYDHGIRVLQPINEFHTHAVQLKAGFVVAGH